MIQVILQMNYSTSTTTKVVNYKDIDRVRGAHRYVSLYALINIYSIDVIGRKTTTTKNSHHQCLHGPAVDSVLCSLKLLDFFTESLYRDTLGLRIRTTKMSGHHHTSPTSAPSGQSGLEMRMSLAGMSFFY